VSRTVLDVTVRATEAVVGDRVVVALEGSADLAAVATLHASLTRTSRRHAGETVVVDLDGLATLDDAALGVLLGAAAAARESGGDLEVVCTRTVLLDRLGRSGFDRAVTVRSSIS
jgi:anti-anti-sigma factor